MLGFVVTGWAASLVWFTYIFFWEITLFLATALFDVYSLAFAAHGPLAAVLLRALAPWVPLDLGDHAAEALSMAPH